MDEEIQENLTEISIYLEGLECDCEAGDRYITKLNFSKGPKSLPVRIKFVLINVAGRNVIHWPSLELGQIYTDLILSPANKKYNSF